MAADLRLTLHTLADRLCDVLDKPQPTSQTSASVTYEAIVRVSQGDLSLGPYTNAPEGSELAIIGEIVKRVRVLVIAAKAVVSSHGDRITFVRNGVERVAEANTKQRVGLERLTQSSKELGQQVSELSLLARSLGEGAERASILALNTGIEGLRGGGELARTLTNLGDEQRKLAQKSVNDAREMAAGLSAVVESMRLLTSQLEEASQAATKSIEEAVATVSLTESVRRDETLLSKSLSRFRVMDDRTESVVSEIHNASVKLRDLAASINATTTSLTVEDQSAIRQAWSELVSQLGSSKG